MYLSISNHKIKSIYSCSLKGHWNNTSPIVSNSWVSPNLQHRTPFRQNKGDSDDDKEEN